MAIKFEQINLKAKVIDYLTLRTELSIFHRKVNPVKQYLLKVIFTQLINRFNITQ
ncbi:hypothetical protein VCR12J2_640349 [Vibrio coralliirubri]|nr:hypothetical protein VCR12J2_640349 [Vibrio coralliirubri]